MNVKSMLLLLSLFLFSSAIHAMEENNLPELPLLEEIFFLHSSTISLLDTNAWNPTIEQEIQKTNQLAEVLFPPDSVTTEEQPFWCNTTAFYEKQPATIITSAKKSYVCSYCNAIFKYMSSRITHERIHTGNKPFICNYPNCGYASSQMGSLNFHQRTHTGEKPYPCDYPNCNHAFTRNSHLTRHKCVHTDEKLYLCDYQNCGYASSQKNDLVLHKCTHTGEKPLICNYQNCGKSFVDRSNLRSHQRTHKGERPFICNYPQCNGTFTKKSSFIRHQRTHTGERPFICDYPNCGKAFTWQSSFNNHKKKHSLEKLDAAIIVVTKKARLDTTSSDSCKEEGEY